MPWSYSQEGRILDSVCPLEHPGLLILGVLPPLTPYLYANQILHPCQAASHLVETWYNQSASHSTGQTWACPVCCYVWANKLSMPGFWTKHSGPFFTLTLPEGISPLSPAPASSYHQSCVFTALVVRISTPLITVHGVFITMSGRANLEGL